MARRAGCSRSWGTVSSAGSLGDAANEVIAFGGKLVVAAAFAQQAHHPQRAVDAVRDVRVAADGVLDPSGDHDVLQQLGEARGGHRCFHTYATAMTQASSK